MNQNNNQKKKGGLGPLIWVIILVSVAVSNAMNGKKDPAVLIPVIAVVVLAVVIATVASAAKRGGAKGPAGAKPAKKPAPTAAKPVRQKAPGRKDEVEEAIHCAHTRGKEKYLEQVDNFLKAGLIDRDEYKVLKARYEKLDIPDDYH